MLRHKNENKQENNIKIKLNFVPINPSDKFLDSWNYLEECKRISNIRRIMSELRAREEYSD